MSFNYALTRSDTGLQRRDDGLYYRANANEPIGVIGTDGRPIGAWIPKPLTNLFRDSEPATDPGQGTRTALTFGASTLGLGFSTALDGMVTLSGGSTSRVYHNVASAPANNSQGTVAFICQKIAGGEPTVNSGTVANDDIQAIWGGGSVTSVTEVTKTALGSDLYFVRVKLTAAGTATTATGVQQSNTYAGTGVRVSAIMAVAGHVDVNLFDYIRTTGSSVARAATDIRNTSFPELASLQGFIDVEINNQDNQSILMIGLDNSNRIRVGYFSSLGTFLQLLVGNTQQWIIQSNQAITGRYRISYYASDGLNVIWVDNVEIGRNTGVYAPQGTIKVLGGNITGTNNKLTDGGIFNEYIDSGKSESELLAVSSFNTIEQLYSFKRLESDSLADLTALITTLETTTV